MELEPFEKTHFFHRTPYQESTIPFFSRIRTVTIDTDGTMVCTCCLFERQGLPCTHQACVADLCHETIGSCFAGFTHHDIHVRWRSNYMYYAHKQTTHPDMYINFHLIAIKSSGPNLWMMLPNSLPIHPRVIILLAIDCLKNHKKEDIDDSLLKI